MNNKIPSIKLNAIFLATVLVLGTITLLSSSSFMKYAQAQQDYYYGGSGMENTYNNNEYGKDSNYYESSKDSSSKIVKKVNCNNINVNVNGLELNGLPLSLANLVGDGEGKDEGRYGASSYGSSEQNYGNSGQSDYGKDFKFICLNNNNNNNKVIVPSVEECAEADEIEACFANAEFMGEVQFPEFVAALEAGITVEINGQDITLRSFNDICLAFEGLTTYQQLRDAVNEIGIATGATFGEGFLAVVDCIAEALDIPIPPR